MGVLMAFVLIAGVLGVLWLISTFSRASLRSDGRILDVLARGVDAESELARLEQQAIADMTDEFTRRLYP